MSTPLSFCDISARYGQMPAPQQSIEEQTGWNPKQLFLDYMRKVREQREKNAKDAEEDALMAMIDAMNASEEDKASGRVKWVDPTQTLTVQVLMSCLGDRFTFEQADRIQENQKDQEQKAEEERLEVTEARDPSDTIDPDSI